MKTKTIEIFEVGDVVITSKVTGRSGKYGGYKKNEYAVVINESWSDGEVLVNFLTGNRTEYAVSIDELEYVSPAVAAKLKFPPSLRVDTLETNLEIKGKLLKVGCQEISFEDANKIADFIKEHCKAAPANKKTRTKSSRKPRSARA